MEDSLHGPVLKQEYLKNWYLDHYYFLFILMICLSDDLKRTNKVFIDDTLLNFEIHNMNTSANHLNNDLSKISVWAI